MEALAASTKEVIWLDPQNPEGLQATLRAGDEWRRDEGARVDFSRFVHYDFAREKPIQSTIIGRRIAGRDSTRQQAI